MRVRIEIDNPGCARWYAPMIQREVRGRFDHRRDREPLAALAHVRLGCDIPGQVIELDTDARKAEVIEPLADPRNAKLVRHLAKLMGTTGVTPAFELQIRPGGEKYDLKDERDVATWCYWVRRAVESGVAQVVDGELPPAEMCRGARKQFILPEQKDPAQEERDLRHREVAVKLAMMTPEQRATYQRLMAELA